LFFTDKGCVNPSIFKSAPSLRICLVSLFKRLACDNGYLRKL